MMADEPRTPLHEILAAVNNLEAESDLMKVLNSTAPFYVEISKEDISKELSLICMRNLELFIRLNLHQLIIFLAKL